jgi:hypothetical protein
MHALSRIAGWPLVLAIPLVFEARAGDTLEFKSFSSKEGRFTISFPGKPDQSTSTLKSPIGDMVLHIFKAGRDNDKEAYTLIYYDYPPEAIKSTDPEKIFDTAQQGGLDATHCKLVKKTDIIKTDKVPASRDLEIEIQAATTYARMILVANRLYVIMAVPAANQGAADHARKYFDSFKLAADAK